MAPTPSLGIVNASIWTADPDRPRAGSLSIEDGVVTSLDEDARARACDRIIDVGGGVVAPGLIDAHTHFLMGGESLAQLDLSGVASREAFEAAIHRRHAELPPGAWLRAHGWSQEHWGGGMPDKSWLRAAADRPVVAYRMDSHACLVNDPVLALCDLTATFEDGRIERDAADEPTGMMYEAAAWRLVNPVIPEASIEAQREAVLRAQEHALSLGVTTVGAMEYGRDVQHVFAPLRDRLDIRIRVTLLDRETPVDFSFGESFASDDALAVIGYKTFLDGTFGSGTARMLEPWSDDPDSRGMWCELAATGELDEWIAEVARRGFQPSLHAIGDAASRRALDAIDLIDEVSSSVRPRIEHAQQLDPADIPRFRGCIASMQPLHKAEDAPYARKRVGDARLAGFYAFRRLKEAGAILAFGSDWPIVTVDPIPGIRAAVTGLSIEGEPFATDQNVSVEETLRAYTIDAAFALRFEERVGSIARGKLGDLVIFDRDPFTADWASAPPRIATTIAGGRVVHDAEQRSTPTL